ncbi:MAG TPA: NAD-dependent malic enzyme [Candidatus Bathyarchaeia archaeon]|nr:NAD-dependent malic enzyme [Candidatus Bathyarchaeia archaeon]
MSPSEPQPLVRGPQLLSHPLHNKGSAFTRAEREAFGLEGLLPYAVNTLEQQARRVYENLARKTDPLERYIGLASLEDRNEHLFHYVLEEHLEEFLPIVYTPTVGRACQQFSHIFRRARGLWITPEHRGHIGEVLGNWPEHDVRLIVVTDNERILGLGDQGAGGMGIPIGKVAVYTAAAGIHPRHTLPISLDVGTDNQRLLDDDLYLGWPHRRLRGSAYDRLVDEFVVAVRRRFPRALLQWEDFKKQNAFNLLDRHRRTLPSFNDDIQGTGAVVLAGIMAASRVTGIPLAGQRVVILGAGAAGIGIARQIRDALEGAGLAGPDLTRAVALVDVAGLLALDGQPLDEFQRPFAWPAELARASGLGAPHGLLAVVRAVKPTVLIGACGQGGVFGKDVVEAMIERVDRPLILPLSNPTSQSEAVPAEVIAWTGGRALVAAGSPFEPVTHGGREIRVGQCNNAFIFPGMGLGALVAEAREVTERMFRCAAECLAGQLSDTDLVADALYPRIRDLRRVSARIAVAVAREARESGVGRALDDEAIARTVAEAQWKPGYQSLV